MKLFRVTFEDVEENVVTEVFTPADTVQVAVDKAKSKLESTVGVREFVFNQCEQVAPFGSRNILFAE